MDESGAVEHTISTYTLPERLRYLRRRREISQKELATSAGVSQSTIAQIESGKKDPSVRTLRNIAAALDIEIAVLFATDDILVFDLKRLNEKYDNVDKLNATLYMALGKVLSYALKIGFTKPTTS